VPLQKQAVSEHAFRSIYDERSFSSFLLGLYDRTRRVSRTAARHSPHKGIGSVDRTLSKAKAICGLECEPLYSKWSADDRFGAH
jgi:hypothetical protein